MKLLVSWMRAVPIKKSVCPEGCINSIPFAPMAHSPHGCSNAGASGDGIGAVRRTAWLFSQCPNIRYDGRFTFARIRYQTAPGRLLVRRLARLGNGYPLSEQNLMSIMCEVTYLARKSRSSVRLLRRSSAVP
jgi:hypothetical protein